MCPSPGAHLLMDNPLPSGEGSGLEAERRHSFDVVCVGELIDHRDAFEFVALLQKHCSFGCKRTGVAGYIHDSRRHQLRDDLSRLLPASGSRRIQQHEVRSSRRRPLTRFRLRARRIQGSQCRSDRHSVVPHARQSGWIPLQAVLSLASPRESKRIHCHRTGPARTSEMTPAWSRTSFMNFSSRNRLD